MRLSFELFGIFDKFDVLISRAVENGQRARIVNSSMVVNITSRNRQSTDADELNTAQQNASHHFVSKLKVVFHFSAPLSEMQSGIRIGQLNLNFGNG